MLDIKLVRENPKLVKEGAKNKGFDVDIDAILKADKKRREYLVEIENFRALQNKVSKEVAEAQPKEREKIVREMKGVSEKIKSLTPKLEKIEEKLNHLMLFLPNLPHESVPIGKDESENVVVRKWKVPTKFDFKPKDHTELASKLDLIDIKSATKASGTRFYYLKKEAVLLEFALIQFVFKLLISEGFIPVIPPVLVKEEIMEGGGYLPGGEREIYKTTRDDLYLVGTSEQSILGMYTDKILDGKLLPLKYVGFSSCFRREAGSYGKDTKGIFRVHQFDKVEMFSFTKPELSWDEHEYFLSLEEKIMQELKIPYQVVVMCTGDLGAPAAKKYDIEAWMPSEGRYRETHSTSNCTDFQARRLNIRYREKSKKGPQFVHTLNGTAIAIGRMLIAIFENYQRRDGSVAIPEVLGPYMGNKKRIEA